MEFRHISVLLNESIQALAIRPDGLYIDCTLGGGGHAHEILAHGGRLIGIDRDQTALDAARERLKDFSGRFTLIKDDFRNLDRILTQLHINRADGFLFDLGVSSPQLDCAERGFSYMLDAPLDMRMDQSCDLRAWDVVNTWSEEELRRILYTYGEERYAPQIAAAIVHTRTQAPIETTLALVQVIRGAMPGRALREKQHPAKRSFQAIRIAVNGELSAVELGVQAAIDHLASGARLAVITFHSLEDRIVKLAMQKAAKGCICPPELPVCVCGKTPTVRLITKKPIVADTLACTQNPRARSAKLRVAEGL